MRVSALALLLARVALALHPFAPRSPPLLPRPFFNGWCLRCTDPRTGASASAIVGSFSRGRGRYASHLVAVTARAPGESGALASSSAQRVYDGDACRFTRRGGEAPAFAFLAPCGELVSDGGALRARFSLPDGGGGYVSVEIAGEDVGEAGWAGGGAEGWLGSRLARWALPCRYHVRSLASAARCEARADGAAFATDGALLHAESNFGRAFPTAWTWCQAAAEDATLLAVGGAFRVGPAALPNTWLVKFATPDIDWAFRTTDARTSAATAALDPPPGGGTLKLAVVRRVRGETRALEIAAEGSHFLEPLAVPTKTGFSKDPGTRECLDATVRVTALLDGVEVASRTFDGACLEFGGAHLLS